MPADKKLNCTNCHNALQEQDKYCGHCGQREFSVEKPIRPVLAEMLHETLDIDGRMLLTMKTLLTKPGQLSLEYKNGRRNRYTPPLRMYLVISILFFLIFSLSGIGESTHVENSAARTEHFPKLMFVLLPLFALLLQLLFRGTFYLSNLVFAIHIHCMAFLVLACMLPMEVFEKTYPVLVVMQFPLLLFLLLYIGLALKRYYVQSWSKVITKFVVLLLVYSSAMGLGFDFLLHALV